VWCVTPNRRGCFHRFFDTPAISPSGRYLGCLEMAFEDRMPEPGDEAGADRPGARGGEQAAARCVETEARDRDERDEPERPEYRVDRRAPQGDRGYRG